MTRREIALLVTLGLLAVYSVNAHATGGGSNVPSYTVNTFADGGTSISSSRSAASATSSAQSTASASGGNATASGGTGGNASAVVNVNGTGGTSSGTRRVTVNSVGIAPDMIASPTAPCRIALGAGGGWVGGALSIFGSTLDEGCELRENARLLNNLGRQSAAVVLLCNDAKVAKVLPECATEER